MRARLLALGCFFALGCEPVPVTPPSAASAPASDDGGVVAVGVLRRAGKRELVVRSGGVGRLAGGAVVLDAAGLPVSPDKISPALDEGDRLELGRQSRYVLTRLGGGLRWLQPAHSPEDVALREREIDAELAKLSPSLRSEIAARTRIIAVVSAAEGSFGGIATHAGDPAASLGIFQWAMARKRIDDDGSSMSRLFGDLKRRATKASADRDFYAQAWDACVAAGLDVRGSRFFLHDQAATGEAVEQALHAPMEQGALRSYQLVAANDWIERIAAQPVSGRTVGEIMHDPHALATAVLLGVNRPSYVVPALERALKQVGTDDVDRLVREFRHEALAMYRPPEREQRAMRLLTSDAAW